MKNQKGFLCALAEKKIKNKRANKILIDYARKCRNINIDEQRKKEERINRISKYIIDKIITELSKGYDGSNALYYENTNSVFINLYFNIDETIFELKSDDEYKIVYKNISNCLCSRNIEINILTEENKIRINIIVNLNK